MDTNTMLALGGVALVGYLVWSRQSQQESPPYEGIPSSELTASQRQEREAWVQSQRWGDEAWREAYMSGVARDPRYIEPSDSPLTLEEFGVTYRIPYEWAREGWTP